MTLSLFSRWKQLEAPPASGMAEDLATTSSTAANPTLTDLERTIAETTWKWQILQQDTEFWTTRPPELREVVQGDCRTAVHVGSSPGKGRGLLASRDIVSGTLVSLYPVGALGVNFADGTTYVHGPKGYDHTASPYILSLLTPHQVFWNGLDLHRDFDGAQGFVDAGPLVDNNDNELDAAWSCHLINDGARILQNTPASVVDYYQTSLEAQNTLIVPWGPAPLCAALATRDICAGEELLTCYGRSYWLGALLSQEMPPEPWSERTPQIQQLEQGIGQLLQECVTYVQDNYEVEAQQWQQAMDDIL